MGEKRAVESSNGEDETIEALRVAHRRAAEADPRWRALTLGALSTEEAEALRREDPDLYEIHRPFDDDDHARLLDRVEARLPRRSRAVWWRRPIPEVAAALAAAAALALAVVSTRPRPLDLAWSASRGDTAPAHLSSAPGDRLTEMIVPVHPVDGPIAVRGSLLLRPGGAGPGSACTWPLHVVPSRDHEIILSGTRAELFPGVASGDWDMIVVVGRPGPALSDDEVRRLAGGGSSRDLVVLRRRVVLEDGP